MVGTGMNHAANSDKADLATSPALDLLDIAGYNYASGRYPKEGIKHPDRMIFGSETFPADLAKNWAMVLKYPYLIGDFMWTAWDYLGETGLGAWAYSPDGKGFNKPYPWLLAECGALDILGHPNASMFLAQAVWKQISKPIIAVQPVNHPRVKPAKAVWRGSNGLESWAWRGCEGNEAKVEVYFDAHHIDLFLNGKKVGRKRVKNCKAQFKLKFHVGIIKAIAYDGSGKQIGEKSLQSAKGKIKLEVKPEERSVAAGEIVYIDISLVGENCVVEMNADRLISLEVENGELLGFGSANPRTNERYVSGKYTTYYGRAQAVIRCGASGIVRVKAKDLKHLESSAEIAILS